MAIYLPGQDSGRALVKPLYGVESLSANYHIPSPKTRAIILCIMNGSAPEAIYAEFPQSDFSKRVFINYRDFDARNITPRFGFGFGLIYTTFEYSGLLSEVVENASTIYLPPAINIIQGGVESLWDVIA